MHVMTNIQHLQRGQQGMYFASFSISEIFRNSDRKLQTTLTKRGLGGRGHWHAARRVNPLGLSIEGSAQPASIGTFRSKGMLGRIAIAAGTTNLAVLGSILTLLNLAVQNITLVGRIAMTRNITKAFVFQKNIPKLIKSRGRG
jgi:hypothetical protein